MCDCYGTCDMCRRVKTKNEYVYAYTGKKEEKMIKFEDVQVGDRVKLVNENGDTAEITVTDVVSHTIYSEMNGFPKEKSGWSVAEILPRPMPNKPGTILQWGHPDSKYVKTKRGWASIEYDRFYPNEYIEECYRDSIRGSVVVEYEPK